MTPKVVAARTGIQIGLAEAIVIVADLFPGDDARRAAAAVCVGAFLAFAQNVAERMGGWKLFVGNTAT